MSHGVLGHDPASPGQLSSATEKAGLVHSVLLYRGTDEYLDGILPFVRHGVAVGEPVLVSVPDDREELVRAALGPPVDGVRLVNMAHVGGNPGRIIPMLDGFADEHASDRTRVVSESVWAGRSEVEYPECVQHEALVNLALADRPMTILCPYDAGRLAPSVLADAASTHPIVAEHAEWRANPGFADPLSVADAWNSPLPEPEGVSSTLVFSAPDGPRQVRRVTHEVAARAGLSGRRLTDLLLAVNEVAVNTLLHTGHPGLFSIWCADGQVVCQVQDSGHITDPLAGRRRPAPHDTGGHGLRLVNDLCDLVRIHTRPGETTVRLHMQLQPGRDAAADTVPAAVGVDPGTADPLPMAPLRHSRPPGRRRTPPPPRPGRHEDAVTFDGPRDDATLDSGPRPNAPAEETGQPAPAPERQETASPADAVVPRQAAYVQDAGLYEARSAVFHHWRRRLVERLHPGRGDVVFDVGCGTGLCFALLQQRIGPGGTIIGIDPSAAMLDLARQRSAAHGWNNVLLIEASAEDAVIPQVADHALFCAVHDVLQSPAALRNVLARIRPGGSVAAVGGKWAPPWAIGLNALVATAHAPFVRDFTGFDRPWARLAEYLTNLQVSEIEMGCGYLAVGTTPAHRPADPRSGTYGRSRTPRG